MAKLPKIPKVDRSLAELLPHHAAAGGMVAFELVPEGCYLHEDHEPVPRYLQGHHIRPTGAPFQGPAVGERVWICGTGHDNVHRCLRERLVGEAERKHYGKRTWDLATEAFKRAGLEEPV